MQVENENNLVPASIFAVLASIFFALASYLYGNGFATLGFGFLGLASTALLETAFAVIAEATKPSPLKVFRTTTSERRE